MPAKKTVIVVKNLKEYLSPKKQILVSRPLKEGDNIDELQVSLLGNASPQVKYSLRQFLCLVNNSPIHVSS